MSVTFEEALSKLSDLADILRVTRGEAAAERIMGERRAIQYLLRQQEDACIPRVPKAEWFDMWLSWWIWTTDGSNGPSGLIFVEGKTYFDWEDLCVQGFNGTQDGCGFSWRIDKIEKCLPVKAETWKDYPVAVGWQVVGE